MSRHDEACSRLLALLTAVLLAHPARAQTIADYSRAQRSLLESAMTQAAARSAGLGAAAPGTAASTVANPPVPAPRAPTPSLASAVQVSGVFASSAGSVAEVVVNATAYLLGAGQGVPGTTWHVESIAIDRVVLSRHDAGGVAAGAEGARRVFPLPALR
jgi:type IV pilus biogenesis protein PilP